ncbi:hypothetical protein LQ757_15595 [Agromyces sp. SYSU K20354]|uniref:hypothetical protein n=1 Tax=Agromyces cavernae TaxID=2898659 RepID=UPI001E2F50A4|nr:hypothetical protein [Agromyces cavernae]MCD2443704.1 hypothetical protein [Agromyces cavernae]
MDLLIWLAGFGGIVACAVIFLVLRQRRTRGLPADDDAAVGDERPSSDAMGAAHTAGVLTVRYSQNNGGNVP